MHMTDAEDYRMFCALQHDKQRRLVKARAIAEKAAFDDLPRNEQTRYLSWALQAVKDEETKQ